MTRDEITRMALQAGLNEHLWLNPKIDGYEDEMSCLEAFADLVAAEWQEKCNTYMELHNAVVKDSDRLYAAVANLIRVKGRHNTELAYQRLIAAYDKRENNGL